MKNLYCHVCKKFMQHYYSHQIRDYKCISCHSVTIQYCDVNSIRIEEGKRLWKSLAHVYSKLSCLNSQDQRKSQSEQLLIPTF